MLIVSFLIGVVVGAVAFIVLEVAIEDSRQYRKS